MNSSALALLGAFDTLIHLIKSEGEALGKFDRNGAICSLEHTRNHLAGAALDYCRAEYRGLTTLQSTIDQMSKGIPQGSDLERILAGYKHCISTFLSHGPIPPGPSSSSTSNPFLG